MAGQLAVAERFDERAEDEREHEKTLEETLERLFVPASRSVEDLGGAP